jgi:hypothetical protein
MTLRDLVLAGVLPISFLAPASSASFLHKPDFSPPAPLFLAQAEISPERIAAREQYELALEQRDRAEQALSKAEKAGGDRYAEQLAAAQAEKELLKARRVLVELVMYDIPRSLLEEEAFRAERSAQANAATAQGRTEAGSSAEVLAEKGTSGTREGDADRGARADGNDQSSERAALRASGAEKSIIEAEVQTAGTELDGPVAEVESELAVPPEVQILKETAVDDAPVALGGDGTDVDFGPMGGERRREERSAAADRSQDRAENEAAISGEDSEALSSKADRASYADNLTDDREQSGDQDANAAVGAEGETTAEPGEVEFAERNAGVLPGKELSESDAAENVAPQNSGPSEPGLDVDLSREDRRRVRKERRAAAGQSQEDGGLARSNAEAGERSDGEQPVASEQARPQSMAERLNQTTSNQSQTTINQSVDTNQSTVNQTLSEQTVQQQQVIEGKRGRAANVKGEARLSPLERMRRRVGLPRLD